MACFCTGHEQGYVKEENKNKVEHTIYDNEQISHVHETLIRQPSRSRLNVNTNAC